MANGHTKAMIQEVDALLEDGNIPIKTSQKFTLAIVRENYQQLQDLKSAEDEKNKIFEQRIKKLEDESIIRWVKENKKASVIIGIIFCIIFISDLRQPVLFWFAAEWRNLFYWIF